MAILHNYINSVYTNSVTAGDNPAVYIHIPFCRKKCDYCDFVSMSIDADVVANNPIDEYLEVLAEEFSLSLPFPVLPQTSSVANLLDLRSPPTIYIGGGTPSVLSEKQIEFLLTRLCAIFSVRKNTEFTFEVNPESVTESKLKILKDFGVNRLSFGLQAFDNNLLKTLGRVHTKEDFLEKFDLARKIGFENINIDLIFGIPEQTLKNWQKTLTDIMAISPEHISVYSLTIEEGTSFHKNDVVVDDDLSADMFQFAIEYLKKNNYKHYEISNFCRPMRQCKHNINYWYNGEYIGFGLGAVSYIKGKRIKNTENFTDYLGGKFQLTFEELNCEQKMSEDLMLGLRLIDGMKILDNMREKFLTKINNLKNDGLLEEQDNFLKLTDRGIVFANCVFREFL
ncbi:MAG: radical SAM family heme chaperone HemW [Elusimicrobiota bacterium]